MAQSMELPRNQSRAAACHSSARVQEPALGRYIYTLKKGKGWGGGGKEVVNHHRGPHLSHSLRFLLREIRRPWPPTSSTQCTVAGVASGFERWEHPLLLGPVVFARASPPYAPISLAMDSSRPRTKCAPSWPPPELPASVLHSFFFFFFLLSFGVFRAVNGRIAIGVGEIVCSDFCTFFFFDFFDRQWLAFGDGIGGWMLFFFFFVSVELLLDGCCCKHEISLKLWFFCICMLV